LVFSRDIDNQQLVCAFNLGSRAAEVDLGAETELEAVEGHGFAGRAEAGKIKLSGYGAWFGRLA
jgi:alpha-glucosidase